MGRLEEELVRKYEYSLVIVLSVLNVKTSHHLDFSQRCILLPLHHQHVSQTNAVPMWRGIKVFRSTHVQEVDLLEQFLLMVFELSHVG